MVITYSARASGSVGLVRGKNYLIKKCLVKFLLPKCYYYLYSMEQAVTIKRELVSKVSGVRIAKGSIAIYSSTMRAVRVNTKSNKSDLWIGVRENDISIIDWIHVK